MGSGNKSARAENETERNGNGKVWQLATDSGLGSYKQRWVRLGNAWLA